MEKLKLLGASSPEFNVTRTYLDWLTILPWGVYSKDSYDQKKAARILDRDHYGLEDVKNRILELISVGVIKGDLSGTISALTGPARCRQDLDRQIGGPKPRQGIFSFFSWRHAG